MRIKYILNKMITIRCVAMCGNLFQIIFLWTMLSKSSQKGVRLKGASQLNRKSRFCWSLIYRLELRFLPGMACLPRCCSLPQFHGIVLEISLLQPVIHTLLMLIPLYIEPRIFLWIFSVSYRIVGIRSCRKFPCAQYN